MAEVALKIEGMSCQHCVTSVKKAVDAVDGVTSSQVSVGSATVVFNDRKTDRDAIVQAVQNAGYTVL